MAHNQYTCTERIRWVASSIHNGDLFKERATKAATQLGPEAIDILATLFHSEHTPPKELADQFPGLGSWIAARQCAIFEMFYHFGEAALPVLRKVAFGKYDWTQGNALEVLCRMAADGVDREAIIADMRRAFPRLRFEAQLYMLRPLLGQAAQNVALAEVLRRFEDIPEYREVVAELQGNA